MKQLLIFLVFLGAFSIVKAQPRPDWAASLPHAPQGANFIYASGVGEGVDRNEAEFYALNNAMYWALNEGGLIAIPYQKKNHEEVYTMSDVKEVIEANVLKRSPACKTPEIMLQNGKVRVYILLQVQKDGGNSIVNFEPYCGTNYSDFEKRVKEWNDKEGGFYPFSARVFVPGMAQIYKGSNTKGILFIAGEVVFVGGIVACEGLRASYQSKINTTHDVNAIQYYANNASNMQNLRNGFIVGAAALYVWNVIDGIASKGVPRRKKTLSMNNFKLMPYVNPNYSYGVNFAFNF